jgi:predicted ferric reductase
MLDLAGRMAGVLGLSFFLLAAIISARVPGFDIKFGGLTRLWKTHHILGAASFLLLLAHPMLLAFAAARVSPRAAAAVLFSGPDAWSLWAGWLALAAMTAFLAPTFWFFGQPHYQRWKALHALSGPAMALGLAHAVCANRLLSGGWGKAVWPASGALALLAFVYRVFLARRLTAKEYVIVQSEAIGRDVVELTLKPEAGLLAYRPGQFIYLTPLSHDLTAGRGEEHPYTVSSSPHEPVLRVAIKDLGDASHALQSVPLGSRALVEGPYGNLFPANAPAESELWIAGGIGLTPFLSRARSLRAESAADIHLIYCVQDETRAFFLPELEALASKLTGFRVSTHFFGREGTLNSAYLTARCPDYASREIYVCGPPELLHAAKNILRQAGVSAARLHSEEFTWL